MKRTMKKMLSFGLVAAMSLTMLAGCGNSKDATNDTNVSNGQEEKKPTGDVKIGVLVQDVSGEEALGFRSYYENYIADQYGVTFTYTDELKDAASEKSAIEKFASQGYQAVISFSSNDRALQIETCEENKIYYAVAAGTLDQEQFEKYKTDEYFLGQVGPSMDTEYEAGVAEGLSQGVANGLVTLRWGGPLKARLTQAKRQRNDQQHGHRQRQQCLLPAQAGNQPPFHRHHQKLPERACRCGHAHGPRAPLGRNLPAQHAVDHGVGGACLRCPDQEAGGECKQERGGRKRHARQSQAVQNGTAHQHAERAKPVGRHARKDPDHAPRQILQRNRKSERLAGPPHLLGDGL